MEISSKGSYIPIGNVCLTPTLTKGAVMHLYWLPTVGWPLRAQYWPKIYPVLY